MRDDVQIFTARRVIRTSVSSYSNCRWSESPGVFARDSGGSGADQTATVKHARAAVIRDKIKRKRIAVYLPQRVRASLGEIGFALASILREKQFL
jgi:hypothetical protein